MLLLLLATFLLASPFAAPVGGDVVAAESPHDVAEDGGIYHCSRCGRALFRDGDVAGESVRDGVPVWRLGASFVPGAEAGLRSVDTKGGRGWYGCRRALWRAAGSAETLARKADVERVAPGGRFFAVEDDPVGLRLTVADYPHFVTGARDDRLKVVKFGALWCIPCKEVDVALRRLLAAGSPAVAEVMGEVDLFDIDVDDSPRLFERQGARLLPLTTFWYGGRPLRVVGPDGATHAGGLLGPLPADELGALLRAALEAGRAGRDRVVLR